MELSPHDSWTSLILGPPSVPSLPIYPSSPSYVVHHSLLRCTLSATQLFPQSSLSLYPWALVLSFLTMHLLPRPLTSTDVLLPSPSMVNMRNENFFHCSELQVEMDLIKSQLNIMYHKHQADTKFLQHQAQTLSEQLRGVNSCCTLKNPWKSCATWWINEMSRVIAPTMFPMPTQIEIMAPWTTQMLDKAAGTSLQSSMCHYKYHVF